MAPDIHSGHGRLPTERDIRILKDPAFTVPKRRPSGNFGVFLEDVFAEFRTRIGQFEPPLAAIMDRRSMLRRCGRGQPQARLPHGGHVRFWPAGGIAAALSLRWERSAKNTLSATIPIVNHQL
jgi:hypothetical protein